MCLNLPSTVQVGKVDGPPHFTEYLVTDPAEQRQRPPDPRDQAQLEHTWVFTPAAVKHSSDSTVYRTVQKHILMHAIYEV